MLSVQKDCIDEMDLSEASLDRFGLSLSFSSEIVHYLKSQRMEELDRDLGDIHGAIVVGHSLSVSSRAPVSFAGK